MPLQALYTNLLFFKVDRSSTFKRLLAPPKPPKGVYFWGGVGRGKSFLMDCFYDSVPYRRKKRIHFHAFMQQIHRDLEQYKGEPDPVGRSPSRSPNRCGCSASTNSTSQTSPMR
jgi:cell division protein ZapE